LCRHAYVDIFFALPSLAVPRPDSLVVVGFLRLLRRDSTAGRRDARTVEPRQTPAEVDAGAVGSHSAGPDVDEARVVPGLQPPERHVQLVHQVVADLALVRAEGGEVGLDERRHLIPCAAEVARDDKRLQCHGHDDGGRRLGIGGFDCR